MKTNKIVIVGLVVALVLAGIAFYKTLGGSSDLASATPGSLLIEQYDPYVNQNGGINSALPIQTSSTVTAANVTVGSGTNLTGFVAGTCDLIGSAVSQAASTTVAYDCAVTGLTSSYVAFAQLATTTVRSSGSATWFVSAAKASTTAGYATVLLTNYGPAAVPAATSVGSSTKIWAFKL